MLQTDAVRVISLAYLKCVANRCCACDITGLFKMLKLSKVVKVSGFHGGCCSNNGCILGFYTVA